jgi:aspartyl-tRNA(Asn)/glutamyl-tRNA(Gln) amidotransferase subunit A
MTDIAFATIAELSAAIDARAISPREILQATLARIERLEPVLNAFAALDREGAAADAAAAEDRQMRGERLGPLDGIPTSVKDLIAQRGLPLRFGSRATSAVPALADAPSVARLRAAGAVLLGKSTTSEFGCKAVGDSPLTGITRNPWNPAMTPGGSSAGAAAMVAAGIAPYALGTDGGGSIRIPAALCGLFGIKAQFARVPVYPASATPTLGHVGPLARSAGDAALALGAICGFDRRDPFAVAGPVPDFAAAMRDRRPLRIGWSATFGYARPDPEVAAICAGAVARLETLGHRVEEIPALMPDPAQMWAAEFYAGAGTRLRGVIEETPDLLDPAVLAVLRIAVAQDMGAYYAKVFERYAFREAMRAAFAPYDAIVSPVLPVAGVPAERDMPDGWDRAAIVSWVAYTYPFSLTGQPAASMPVGVTAGGLPVGLQIAARSHDEAAIFALAGGYEAAFGPAPRPAMDWAAG